MPTSKKADKIGVRSGSRGDQGMSSRDAQGTHAMAQQRCGRCGAMSPSLANFCAQCGASFAHDGSAAPAEIATGLTKAAVGYERRQLTVVFCDLVGSTALSTELDAEDFNDIIVGFLRTVTDAMTRFGGNVARYVGDGALIYFGYPRAHEHDAERAIQASLDALEQIAAIQVKGGRKLEARIGIATGLVVIGNMDGGNGPGTPEATGETPNLAARLQAQAQPNTIVVSAATRRLAGGLFEWRDLGPVTLKGLPGPVQAWQVVGGGAVASRYDALRESAPLPMLGRDDARGALLDLWRRAQAGKGQVALISAEAGVGKSRMAAAILEDTDDHARATLRYFCSPYREGSPLYPCIQQIEHIAGFLRDDTPETRLGKLAQTLQGLPKKELALIAELLTLPHGNPLIAQLGPLVKRRRTLHALLATLDLVARQKPTLMIFEDAQWADETTRELMGLVVPHIAKLPVLLLVLARPEYVPEWKSQPNVTSLTLQPLTPEVSAALVHFVAKERPLSPRIVADIVASSDGVPLYLEEVTRAIVESEGDRVAAEPAPRGDAPLPMSLQASLLARLDRLENAREIAEIAAAIGRDFSSDLLQHIVPRPEDLQDVLDRLVHAGIIQSRASHTYMFKHVLIRNAAYDIMVRAKRRPLHARIAQALEEHFPETASDHPEILGQHHEQAENFEKAAPCWLRAGQLALRRSAMTEALVYLRRGIGQLGKVPAGPAWRLQCELDLTIAIGKAQIATQGYAIESTRETFDKALDLCKQMGDPPQLLAVLHGLWTHALLRADFPSAQRQAAALLARGEERADRMWLLMGHRFSGVTHHPLGQFEAARRELECGLELYDPAKRAMYAALTVDDPRVVMLTYLSWSLMCSGRFAEARRCSETAVAEAAEMAHVYTRAHALNGAAFVALTIDTPQQGLIRLDELAAVLADSGIAYYDAVECIFRGYCHAATGAFDLALPLLERGMAAYRATGSILYLSGFLRMSAEAHVSAGHVGPAREMISEALAIMEKSNQRWDEAETHRVHGLVLRAADDEDNAERALRNALSVAQRQGAQLWALRAALSLADVLHARRDAVQARAVLGPVVAGFDASANTPDLTRAHRMLEHEVTH